MSRVRLIVHESTHPRARRPCHKSGSRAWKGHDWAALDRLHKKGLISDPRSKAKSVVLDAAGMRAAEKAFGELFGKSGQ
jgi:hypothetical protein